MHNEERERRDNRPNSVSQPSAIRDRPQQSSVPVSSAGGRMVIDPRLVSPRTMQSAAMSSHNAAATVAGRKKQPAYLNHDDALRLQLNLSDVDEVFISDKNRHLCSKCTNWLAISNCQYQYEKIKTGLDQKKAPIRLIPKPKLI